MHTSPSSPALSIVPRGRDELKEMLRADMFAYADKLAAAPGEVEMLRHLGDGYEPWPDRYVGDLLTVEIRYAAAYIREMARLLV